MKLIYMNMYRNVAICHNCRFAICTYQNVPNENIGAFTVHIHNRILNENGILEYICI